MAERVIVDGESLRSETFSDSNCAGTCVNFICLHSQLSKVLEEVKSLRTIISSLPVAARS
jgi:hypothetical protein